ncbi:MAG: cytochrome c maturation protein CcmE [Desulfovibrio sp.]
MSAKSGKGIYFVALALFLGGLGFLIFSGVSQDSVYFLNVSEAMEIKDNELKNARLFGKVAAENISRKDGSLGVDFDMIDKEGKEGLIRVEYKGVIPDAFKAGVEVIVEGKFKHGVMHAKTLITKCPSKYKKQSDEMEKNG